jgi:sigma-B regulation protein RsbU (phosphoserine phosphatase)
MLTTLLTARYAHFANLAETWLAAGATAFGIWRDDQPLAAWPDVGDLQTPSLVAPIRLGEKIIGDLRVTGITGAVVQGRLNAEAAIVSDLAQLEDELQRMTEELVASRDQLLGMYRLMPSMHQHITPDAILRNLLHETLRIIQARAGFAIFVAMDTQPLLMQIPEAGLDTQLIWRCFWHINSREWEGLLGRAHLPPDLPDDIQDLLFFPLRIRGAVIAGMGLINQPGTSFTTADIKLGQAIADQVSAQIENMLLTRQTEEQSRLQDEMTLAQRVQSRLMPQELPIVAGLDIAAHCQPAMQVGGDFYDFIAHTDRPFIFSIGDVTGKGLSAALLMTMTRSAIHSKAAFLPDPTPETIIHKVNTELYAHFTQVGMFATVFVGQYHPHTRTLVYANAGHAPVIYRPVDGSPRLLEADSTAIGVLNMSFCANQTVTLQPGDLLLVATDGFSDARNPDRRMFGWERLFALVDSLADQPAQAIADNIYQTLEQFAASASQDDDQTLVILKGVE